MDELELNSLYRSVIDNANVGIGITDTDGNFLIVNYAWCRKLGYNPQDVKYLSLKHITMPEDAEKSKDNFKKLVNSEVECIQKLTRYMRKDGSCFWANLLVSPIKNEHGRVTAIFGVFTDFNEQANNDETLFSTNQQLEDSNEKLVSANTEIQKKNEELELAYKKLEEMARTDPLTNLPNRRQLEEHLNMEVNRTKRNQVQFSICLCDVDNFKQINDNYGHDMGDLVLREISEIFKSTIRATDIVGRWGGEEFMFILQETPLDGAMMLLERVRQLVETHKFIKEDSEIVISVSLGASTFYADSELEKVIKQADLALYAAKKSGKNIAIKYTKQLEVIHSIYID